jgi:hypothetical protein
LEFFVKYIGVWIASARVHIGVFFKFERTVLVSPMVAQSETQDLSSQLPHELAPADWDGDVIAAACAPLASTVELRRFEGHGSRKNMSIATTMAQIPSSSTGAIPRFRRCPA